MNGPEAYFFFFLTSGLIFLPTSAHTQLENSATSSRSFLSIYWSDGDSGKLGEVKFRLANIDAPETGPLKQRGGAKCELERELGFEAKAFMVELTRGKTIRIVRDYGKDRYGRLVVDIETEDGDIASAGVNAGHLEKWPHLNGRAQSPKPDWCARSEN